MAITRTKGARAGRVEFEGRVLDGVFSGNRFLMSDYGIGLYARVWDGERVREESVGVSDIGPGADYRDEVVVDATPEVRAAAAAWEQAVCDAEVARITAIEAARVSRGKRVRVVRGRKVPIGTEGVVFWRGSTRFGERVGLRIEGQTEPAWTAASNVEVVVG